MTPFVLYCYAHHRDLHSFPTRRSSDLRPTEEGEMHNPLRSERDVFRAVVVIGVGAGAVIALALLTRPAFGAVLLAAEVGLGIRSEEHTSELQSQSNLVCRLLLEKKKKK